MAKALEQQTKRLKNHAYRRERDRLVGRTTAPEMEAPLPQTVNSIVLSVDGITE